MYKTIKNIDFPMVQTIKNTLLISKKHRKIKAFRELYRKLWKIQQLKKKVPKTLIFQGFQALPIIIFNKKEYRNTLAS